jgi:spermidine/putrescine transport system ATP-binding protein
VQRAVVELRNVSKTFSSVNAVEEVSLEVLEGEFLSLLGPSGSGKTTTLRLIAGFEQPSEGMILIRGRNVVGVLPRHRNIAMVFQNYALFPHMTVFENVAFGLRVRRLGKEEIARRVREHLELVQLPGYEGRFPKELSGGEQQRVALARALVTEPNVLLLDEPLGALDRKLREELQFELKEVLSRVGITAVYVTHDQDEALVMSDRVAVMHKGRIEQLDAPEGLYERPRTRFVAAFVGTSNLFEGTVVRRGSQAVLQAAELALELGGESGNAAGRATLAVRPEKVRIGREELGGETNAFRGRIAGARYLGASTQYRVQLERGPAVLANVLNATAGETLGHGDEVIVVLPPESIRVLVEGSSRSEAPAPEALLA